MTSPAKTLIFVTAAALAFAADAPSLTGRWQVHTAVADRESTQTCAFTQKGNDLTGTCKSDNGTIQITGKVEGKAVSWAYKSEYNGSPLTVTFKGALDEGGKIAGSVTAEEFAVTGDFTATPSK